MVILGYTFREIQNYVPKLKLPWDEPYPDHSNIHRAYQNIPRDYLDSLLEETSILCINVSLHQTAQELRQIRANKKERRFEKARRMIYLKYNIIAILDHLIILKARVTSYLSSDCKTLNKMLASLATMPGCIFNADRGFDAEYNFKRIHELMMRANIKQKIMNNGRKRLYYRKRAMNEFDKSIYRWRGMIEAIFGAESNKNKLMTRSRKKEDQERWGIIIAIGWNLKVLNRLRFRKNLGMEVKSIIRN